MKKKSILSLFLALLLCFSSFTCFAQSEKTGKVTIEKHDEITDMNILMKRAKEGIDESRNKSKFHIMDNSKAVTTNIDTNEKVELDTVSTTQLLEISVENGITTTSYATTTATLSREDSASSTGGDVGASSTIYWNEYTISSGGQQVAVVKLIKAIGRWYIYQGGVVLSNLLVQGLQQGWRSPKGSVVDSLYHVPSTYTSVTQEYTFSPIEEDALWCMLSFNMTCDWKRGSGNKVPFEFINCQNFVSMP